MSRANSFNTEARKAQFIAALREHGTVYHACIAAGISRPTPYAWRKRWKAFADAWDDAISDCCDVLEGSVYRKGIEGDMRAAEIWLKANLPEKYRERQSIEHSGRIERVDAEAAYERIASRLTRQILTLGGEAEEGAPVAHTNGHSGA